MSSSAAEARAIALFQSGRIAEAEQLVREALAISPRSAGALHLLGCIRAQAGAREEALRLLDDAIALAPRDASMLNNRARVLVDSGRLEDAARDLRRAAQLQPDFRAATLHLANVLRLQAVTALDAGDAARAEQLLRESLRANALDAGTHNNLGVALQRQGRIGEASTHFSRAVELQPSLADAWVNWGNALENAGDLEAAREKYARAAALAPQSAMVWLNAASNAADRGAYAQAREAYARAAVLRPALADAEYGLGLIDLREQRFAAGWRGYERRFETSPPQATMRAPSLPPFVRGAGRPRVAVWQEQGIGDQVLFSTVLPELRTDADAVVEVDARLVEAYRRSVEGVGFTTPTESPRDFAQCSSQVALGSLAGLYRPDRESFARQPRALLRADPARVAALRAQLGEGRWIGIAWRSVQEGMRGGLAARKSIPLENFARLANAWNARLLDLQYGGVGEERAAFEAAHPGMLVRIEGLDTFGDVDGVLAAIEACEQVVTSSNVTAHLAGALGKRARIVFLGARAPFHYWNAVDGARSLWYPSLEVATDTRWLEWREAFEALAAAP